MRPCPSLPGKGPGRACAVAARAALAVAAALGAGGPAQAGEWSVEVQPVFLEIYGHDQHVLTVHRLDSDAGSDEKTGVLLDTDSELQYRTEIRWARPNWTWGLDFLWVRASQNAGPLTASPSGAIDEVAFERQRFPLQHAGNQLSAERRPRQTARGVTECAVQPIQPRHFLCPCAGPSGGVRKCGSGIRHSSDQRHAVRRHATKTHCAGKPLGVKPRSASRQQ